MHKNLNVDWRSQVSSEMPFESLIAYGSQPAAAYGSLW